MRKALGFCLALVFVCSVFLSGCATPFPFGQLYTDVTFPVAAGEGGSYSKVGTSKSTCVLGLVAIGDASIKAAMANGGINKIKHVDYQAKNILGLFGEYTTTVYGD